MGIFCATERRPFTGDSAGEEANTQKRRVGVRGARAQHLLQETGLQRRKGEQQKPQNETQTEQHNKHTQTLTQTRPHTQQKQTRTHTHTHKHAHTNARSKRRSKRHTRAICRSISAKARAQIHGGTPLGSTKLTHTVRQNTGQQQRHQTQKRKHQTKERHRPAQLFTLRRGQRSRGQRKHQTKKDTARQNDLH